MSVPVRWKNLSPERREEIKTAFREVYVEEGCKLVHTARKIHTDRRTIYRLIEDDPELAEWMQEQYDFQTEKMDRQLDEWLLGGDVSRVSVPLLQALKCRRGSIYCMKDEKKPERERFDIVDEPKELPSG